MASVATTVSVSVENNIFSNRNMSSSYLPTVFDSLDSEELYDEEDLDQFLFLDDDEEESISAIDGNGVFAKFNGISNNDFDGNKVGGEINKEEHLLGRTKIPGSVSMSSFNNSNKNNNNINITRTKSSLKIKSLEEPIPICMNRRSWKNMPAPDMEVVKMKRTASINSFHALSHQDSDVASDEKEEYSSFASIKRHHRSASVPNLLDMRAIAATSGTRKKTASSIPIKRVDSKVSFQDITVREYDVTIGDNPSVSYGTPVSLDWNYTEGVSFDVNEFEANRIGHRRSKRELHMNHYRRKNFLLHSCGYSKEEVKKAQKDADKTRTKREITKHMETSVIPFGAIEELGQSIGRTLKNVATKKKCVSHIRSFSDQIY